MSNTCKNCASWLKALPPDSHPYGAGDRVAGLDRTYTPRDDAAIALIALNGTAYDAVPELRTGPDFGCTKFEPREPNL